MPTDLIAGLKVLRLFGMADALNDMAEQASPRYQHALPILEGLLQAEKADREVRTLKYQLKSAKFPVYRKRKIKGVLLSPWLICQTVIFMIGDHHADKTKNSETSLLAQTPHGSQCL